MMSVRFLKPDETKRPFLFEVAGESLLGIEWRRCERLVCLLRSFSVGNSFIPPSASLLSSLTGTKRLQLVDGSSGARIRTSTIDARRIRIFAEL